MIELFTNILLPEYIYMFPTANSPKVNLERVENNFS